MHLKSSVSCSLHFHHFYIEYITLPIVFALCFCSPKFKKQKSIIIVTANLLLQHKLRLCFWILFKRIEFPDRNAKKSWKTKQKAENWYFIEKRKSGFNVLKCPEKLNCFFLNKLIFKISQQKPTHTHACIQALTHSFSLSHAHIYTHSLPLSFTHINTHTHTHT